MNKRNALLNKIYRAVHDRVCPQCGRDLARAVDLYHCGCGFRITQVEMNDIRTTVVEWGVEPVAELEAWRAERKKKEGGSP